MAERPLSSFFDDWDEEDESETFEDATAGPDGGGAAGGDAGDGDAEATSIEATTRAVASATIDDDDDDDDADDGEEDDEWGDAEWNGADDDEDVAGDASGDGDDRDATNRHEIPFADFSVRTPTERATMHMKRALRRWTSVRRRRARRPVLAVRTPEARERGVARVAGGDSTRHEERAGGAVPNDAVLPSRPPAESTRRRRRRRRRRFRFRRRFR